ncbi:MAG: amidase [Desulfamplus sp.]|nr:amidase [Desulfamplus sp.]
MEIFELSAVEAHKMLCERKISVREYISAYLKRIDAFESDIGAWEFLSPEMVLNQADALDAILSNKKEQPRSLFGVPVGIKDVFNTADMPTCMGSPIWSGFQPGNDARVVEEMRYNHAVILGKTVTAEFAVHSPGKTRNPHNLNHSPGTSSSGSAAAVASQMVPVAIGTQTAGSTIRPASYTGVYGFKPSFGSVPRTGILKTLDTLDHVTFFSRCVDDIKMCFDAVRVRGRNYPFVHLHMDMCDERSVADRPYKVAFVKTHVWDLAEDYVKSEIYSFVEKLQTLTGVQLTYVDLPHDFDTSHDVHDLIYEKSLSYYFYDEYRNNGSKISPIMRHLIERGMGYSKEEFFECLAEQNRLAQLLDNFLAGFDVVISNSTAQDAPEGLYGREEKDPSLMWTLCRVPSLNVPLFKSPRELPFGLQVVSRRFNDYRLLGFVKYLEESGLAHVALAPDLAVGNS